jgi:pSer/pThr/pTyr-binding forkhead associated (FHA) protein
VPFPPPLPTPIPLSEVAPEPQGVFVETHAASSGAAHRLRDGLQIGRSIESELRVLDPSVSRQHATIALRGGAFVLEDLNSQNGTFVNGERIRQRVLCDGDRVNIGEAEFLFRLGDGRTSSAAVDASSPRMRSSG